MRQWSVLVFGALAGSAAAQSVQFPVTAVWHQDISGAPAHVDSTAMLSRLQLLGGWGNGDRLQIDFSFHVSRVASGQPVSLLPVVPHATDDEYYLPDCEPLGSTVPVPADAAFEGQAGLSCDNSAGDCHLLVVDAGLLYEVYNGNIDGGQIDARCLAVWDLTQVYPDEGRGEHCTSADAAGFPIAPLLPNADAVAAAMTDPDGDLGHAIRFILPNERMASDLSLGGVGGRLYVRPASHAGGPSGPADSVPYGARLRLRADFPMTGYNAAAQVILRTMQRYGLVLSDGGNIALTFESDRNAEARWFDGDDALGITPQIFWNGSDGNRTPVRVGDFEVIDTGPRIAETWDCVRTAVTPRGTRVFRNGFEG